MNRILTLRDARKFAMRPVLGIALAFGCCLACYWAAGTRLQAQAPADPGQSQPAAAQNGAGSPSQTQANPFPEDTTTIPVLPSKSTPELFPDGGGDETGRVRLPADDLDPVRSPDDSATDTDTQGQGYSSSLSGLGDVLQGAASNPPTKGKKHQDSIIQPMPRDNSKEDISVGNFYLDSKDWNGALSRFQSALVLDPDNPDVYWGLAECQRHLGNYADARANYQKVVEYDPDSRHGKEARKALQAPEIANAKTATSGQAAQAR
jgi:tetratricopeptide (TPR) repeat protein